MDSSALGTVQKSAFSHQTLEVVRPGGGIQISKHDDRIRLASDKLGHFAQLFVPEAEVLQVARRLRVRAQHRQASTANIDFSGDRRSFGIPQVNDFVAVQRQLAEQSYAEVVVPWLFYCVRKILAQPSQLVEPTFVDFLEHQQAWSVFVDGGNDQIVALVFI